MFKKRILITGGAGFIGANFLEHYTRQHPDWLFVNLDKLTYAGTLDNLKDVLPLKNHLFVEGDICDRSLVENLFDKHQINSVIHFAAESHVDNSIKNPDAFIQTNIYGTFTLLEVAKNHWLDSPQVFKKGFENSRFHHISTDEVYGSLGPKGLFTETTSYAPNSPYSASKASSDMLVRSYFHTYGLPVLTTNCSNNYGPKQHPEKLIPTIIRKALSGENIPIYGDGQNIRDWLYVADHCKGIALVFEKGKTGETYNIGGRNERTNLYIAQHICALLDRIKPKKTGSYQDQVTFVKDRAGHDFRYAIDATKIETELGWKAAENFESGIEKTVRWYIQTIIANKAL
ncbi:MAG: dTDP-glucose 4,6-dehydratase [Flavobacteriaceae bacterium]|nr:dTDP-glucose 4,6-dehydratase [Flavobacteriaceae bacterium]